MKLQTQQLIRAHVININAITRASAHRANTRTRRHYCGDNETPMRGDLCRLQQGSYARAINAALQSGHDYMVHDVDTGMPPRRRTSQKHQKGARRGLWVKAGGRWSIYRATSHQRREPGASS